jgi:hypothetical protein
MIKMMMAAAGLSVGLMMMPVATVPAKAGISIDLNIGGKDRVSCGRGRRIVEDYGFYNVRARSCSGRYYKYLGRRRGDTFVITLDSRRGRIVNSHRVGYY